MGLLRDFGHPVEVWGWDEAYVGADLDDSDDPIELAEQIREVVAAGTGLSCSVGISDNKQRAKVATGFGKPAGVFTLTEANWMAVMGDREVDALWGVGPEDRQKACRAGHHHRRRPCRHRRHAAHVDLRADDRAVDPVAGQGRRRHQRQRRTVGAALAQPRRHLPRRSDRRAEIDSAVVDLARQTLAEIVAAGPRRHPGRRDGAHQDVLHPHQDPQAAVGGQRRRRSSRRPRWNCSTSSNSTGPSGCSACAWSWRRRRAATESDPGNTLATCCTRSPSADTARCARSCCRCPSPHRRHRRQRHRQVVAVPRAAAARRLRSRRGDRLAGTRGRTGVGAVGRPRAARRARAAPAGSKAPRAPGRSPSNSVSPQTISAIWSISGCPRWPATDRCSRATPRSSARRCSRAR